VAHLDTHIASSSPSSCLVLDLGRSEQETLAGKEPEDELTLPDSFIIAVWNRAWASRTSLPSVKAHEVSSREGMIAPLLCHPERPSPRLTTIPGAFLWSHYILAVT
jgi:hypothetical protein